jgi:hypothetical protein
LGLAAAVVFGTLAASSSGTPNESWPTAQSPVFNGLPADTVSEVLSNPKAQDNIRILPSDATSERNALWQGMVVNFEQCRDLLRVYQSWQSTGKAPALASQVLPTSPVAGVTSDAQLVDRFYRAEIASGDISRLRDDLTNESGCGVWIPAKPGDTGGPTIADVVAAS